jgi:hypothetical protein
MNWTNSNPALELSDLDNPVEKAGASESVAIVAILWGIAILAVIVAAE